MPSLDSISFHITALEFEGDREGARVWRTDSGDIVELHYFPLPPDIPSLTSIHELRDRYREMAVSAGHGIIEVDTLTIDDCVAVRTIFKVPQEPTGMGYIGGITLPFRDFSFVVRMMCPEHGMTGVRDSVVGELMMRAGQVKIDLDDEDVGIKGWWQDPYDPNQSGPLIKNISENEEYDKEFPDHPLSRLRSILKQVRDTLRVVSDVKMEPRMILFR